MKHVIYGKPLLYASPCLPLLSLPRCWAKSSFGPPVVLEYLPSMLATEKHNAPRISSAVLKPRPRSQRNRRRLIIFSLLALLSHPRRIPKTPQTRFLLWRRRRGFLLLCCLCNQRGCSSLNTAVATSTAATESTNVLQGPDVLSCCWNGRGGPEFCKTGL